MRPVKELRFNMRSIKDNILFYHDTVQDLLTALNQGIYGAVMVVDDNGVMIGMFTDGDVRRALLSGAKLSEPLERYMNRRFIAGGIDVSRADNLNLLSEKIRHLPSQPFCRRPWRPGRTGAEQCRQMG